MFYKNCIFHHGIKTLSRKLNAAAYNKDRLTFLNDADVFMKLESGISSKSTTEALDTPLLPLAACLQQNEVTDPFL